MKYTITQVFTKEREGKNGKFTSLSIKTQETGDSWISGFLNDDTKEWATGSVVNLLVSSKIVDTNDGQKEYKNFEVIPGEKTITDVYNLINTVSKKLDGMIKNGMRISGHTSPDSNNPYGIDMANHPLSTDEERKASEPVDNLEDIPF